MKTITLIGRVILCNLSPTTIQKVSSLVGKTEIGSLLSQGRFSNPSQVWHEFKIREIPWGICRIFNQVGDPCEIEIIATDEEMLAARYYVAEALDLPCKNKLAGALFSTRSKRQ